MLSAYIFFSFVNIKVFAAPIYLAIFELSSAILRADTLWGIVTLTPEKPIFTSERIVFSKSSTSTFIGM